MSAPFNLDQVKANNPIYDVAAKLSWAAMPRARKTWMTMDCPACGSTDRFGINGDTDGFHCCRASCGIGGDQIALVQLVAGLDFIGAVKWLGGDQEISPEQQEQRERDRAAREAQLAFDEARRAKRDYETAKAVLARCTRGPGTVAETYYREARGLSAPLDAIGWPDDILFHPDLPAFAGLPGARVQVGSFPAAVSRLRNHNGKTVALHRTYLAPDGGGKAAPDTDLDWAAKQVLGPQAKASLGLYLGASAGVTHNPNAPVIVAEWTESVLGIVGAGVQGVFYAAGNLGRLKGRKLRPDESEHVMTGWEPPCKTRPVLIGGDNDFRPTTVWPDPQDRAQTELRAAVARLQRRGYRAAGFLPPAGMDFDDAYQSRDRHAVCPQRSEGSGGLFTRPE